GIDAHGAELQHPERPAVFSYTPLSVKHWTARIELDRQSNCPQHRCDNHQPEADQGQIQHAFGPAHCRDRYKADVSASAQIVDLEARRQQLVKVRQDLDPQMASESARKYPAYLLPPIRWQGDDELINGIRLDQLVELRDRPQKR